MCAGGRKPAGFHLQVQITWRLNPNGSRYGFSVSTKPVGSGTGNPRVYLCSALWACNISVSCPEAHTGDSLEEILPVLVLGPLYGISICPPCHPISTMN